MAINMLVVKYYSSFDDHHYSNENLVSLSKAHTWTQSSTILLIFLNSLLQCAMFVESKAEKKLCKLQNVTGTSLNSITIPPSANHLTTGKRTFRVKAKYRLIFNVNLLYHCPPLLLPITAMHWAPNNVWIYPVLLKVGKCCDFKR